MTIAELHGKLAPHRPNGCHDRMEDLLTSDVFGTMKYAGWKHGFMDWLRSAIHPFEVMNASSVLPNNNDIRRLHYAFWPTLLNGREPDLLIGIECMDGNLVQVMMEAKYLSGSSDVQLTDTEITSYYSGNQIADQVNNFPQYFPELSHIDVATCIHLYVTAHYSCPTDVYESSKPYIRRNDIPLFWVNWQSLPSFLVSAQQNLEDHGPHALLSDLLLLFERKDLLPFVAFNYKSIPNFKSLIGRSFWSQSQAVMWSTPVVPIPKPQHFFEDNLCQPATVMWSTPVVSLPKPQHFFGVNK